MYRGLDKEDKESEYLKKLRNRKSYDEQSTYHYFWETTS